jgi:uncharacterized protein (DUF58 family)
VKTSTAEPALVDLTHVAEIELFLLRRMKDLTLGPHASMVKGSGFDFVGVRDWEPGDRPSSIDWAQSSLTNFSPVITREFEQMSTATVIAAADASLSTRCGAHGVTIAGAVARAIATVGLSSALLQDSFGLIAFDDKGRQREWARPTLGKPHVLYCLDLYQRQMSKSSGEEGPDVIDAIRHLRQASLVPVISDFLFAGASDLIHRLAELNVAHDVFLVMIDARFAFELPPVAAGWIDAVDIETGRSCVVSRREFQRMGARVTEWQDEIRRVARDVDLEVVDVGIDPWQMETALVQFMGDRRLQKLR